MIRTAAIAAAVAAIGCGDPPGAPVLTDGQNGPITRELDVPADQLAELNLRMTGGTEVIVSHTAAVPFQWDVHSHRGSETIIYTQGASASEAVAFTAPEDGLYSYLWENAGTATEHLAIEADLPPGAELDSWFPPLP